MEKIATQETEKTEKLAKEEITSLTNQEFLELVSELPPDQSSWRWPEKVITKEINRRNM